MMPDLYGILSGDSAVVGLLGDAIYRDEAEQGQAAPYTVFFAVSGQPFSTLSDAPEADASRVQFDIYARDQDTADAIYRAMRDALETHGYIVGYRTGRDTETRNYFVSFDMSFITDR